MELIKFFKTSLFLIGSVVLLACGTEKNDVNSEETIAEFERIAESQRKTMEDIKAGQKATAKIAHIIVFGQVQQNEDGAYLHVIEYLKAPPEIRKKKKIPLGNGVIPGQNIAPINGMTLTVFDSNMTIITASQTTRGSQNYESWRNAVHDQ